VLYEPDVPVEPIFKLFNLSESKTEYYSVSAFATQPSASPESELGFGVAKYSSYKNDFINKNDYIFVLTYSIKVSGLDELINFPSYEYERIVNQIVNSIYDQIKLWRVEKIIES